MFSLIVKLKDACQDKDRFELLVLNPKPIPPEQFKNRLLET
jgi:hypothetical protein